MPGVLTGGNSSPTHIRHVFKQSWQSTSIGRSGCLLAPSALDSLVSITEPVLRVQLWVGSSRSGRSGQWWTGSIYHMQSWMSNYCNNTHPIPLDDSLSGMVRPPANCLPPHRIRFRSQPCSVWRESAGRGACLDNGVMHTFITYFVNLYFFCL